MPVSLPRLQTIRKERKAMDRKIKILIDKFGEIPVPTGEKDTWTVNVNKALVCYDGGDTIYVKKPDANLTLALPLTATLRDFEDAANFVWFANEKDAPLWDLERAIIKHYPLCDLSHGREAEGAPTDSWVSDLNFWVKVRASDKIFTLTYWGDCLDGEYYATSVESAVARLIEMDRFLAMYNRDTYESKFWKSREN